MIDFDTVFIRKFMAFAKQTNLYLNHFPRSEKYALSQSIREDMYKIFDLMVEGQKRYYKKTTLTDLDIAHDRLKAKILLAYHLGYFSFKDGKTDDKNPTTMAEKRYATLSLMCSELGKLIGGWIKKTKEENKW
ncbi:MAG: four helix bundle protein [Erysipelotrichia bacterium]|jgi:hypothetical protein|nr:four helix bundle protein [Erysipelotrichia bacterium]